MSEELNAKIAAARHQRPGFGLDRDAIHRHVLKKFTANDNFPVMSSIVTDEATMSEADRAKMKLSRLNAAAKKQASTAVDPKDDKKKKSADPPTAVPPVPATKPVGEEEMTFSQVELIQVIESMDTELKRQWKEGDRVKSLRIAIQGAKIVGQMRVPPAYPSVFVLVSTVLDSFGNLVSERVQNTAVAHSSVVATLVAAGRDAEIDLVPAQAIEMCNNWFLKILSIRELLPRIYVELTLLGCYKYVSSKMRAPLPEVVTRLAEQIRGVADPLIANHARWYLFLRAGDVMGHQAGWANSLIPCALDSLTVIKMMSPKWYSGETEAQYLSYFAPALQWQFDVITKHAPTKADEFGERVLEIISEPGRMHNATILNVMLSSMKAAFLCKHLDEIMKLIETVDSTVTSTMELVSSLMYSLSTEDSPVADMTKAQRQNLLAKMFTKALNNISESNLHLFLAACRSIVLFCGLFMPQNRIVAFLGAVRGSLNPETVSDPAQQEPLLEMLITTCQLISLQHLLACDHFIPILQMLEQKKRSRVVLQIFSRPQALQRTHATAVLELCRVLHDSLPDLATEDEMAEVSTCLESAIRCVDHEKDVDSHLRFLSEARHTLSKMDTTRVFILREALSLVRTLFDEAGRKRSIAKACLAFCHCTCPSILDTFIRLRMGLECASVALEGGFVAQGEALLQFCITTLKEVKPLQTDKDGTLRNADKATKQFAQDFCAVAVIAPPHPKYGYLYGLVALLDWAKNHAWPAWSDGPWSVPADVLIALAKVLDPKAKDGDEGRIKLHRLREDELFLGAADDVTSIALDALATPPTQGNAALRTVEASCYTVKRESDSRRKAAVVAHTTLLLIKGHAFQADEERAEFLRAITTMEEDMPELLGKEVWEEVQGGFGVASIADLPSDKRSTMEGNVWSEEAELGEEETEEHQQDAENSQTHVDPEPTQDETAPQANQDEAL